MMDKLRAAANHILFKIIFVIIILSFIFAGIGGMFSSKISDADIATVNGHSINDREFSVSYQEAHSFDKRLPNESDADFSKRAANVALDNEISRVLFLEKMFDEGVTVSDEDLKQAIRSQEMFFVDGQFNNERYLELLQSSNYTPDSYAENLRQYMANQFASSAIFDTNFALPIDFQSTLLEKQTRTVYSALLPAQKLIKQAPTYTDEEIKRYYDTHQDRFLTEGRVKVEAVGVSTKEVEKRIETTDKEIADYYNKNKKEFTSLERKKISVIRVKTEQEANEILTQLKKGADFSNLSKEKSIYLSLRQRGGDLGWFNIDSSLPEEFVDLALNKKGQLSDVIALNGSYSIFKLDDVVPSKLRTLKEASDDIKQVIFDKKKLEMFDRFEKETQQLLEQNPDTLDPIAKLLNKEIDKTPWVEKGNNRFSYYSFDKMNQELEDLFNNYNGLGNNSPVIYFDSDEGRVEYFYVMRIAEFIPKGVLPFDLIKDQVHTIMQSDWVRNTIEEKTQEIVKELKAGNSSILTENSMNFTVPLTLTRNSTNVNPQLLEKIFNTAQPVNGQAVYDYVFIPPETVWVYMLSSVENAKETDDISPAVLAELSSVDIDTFLFGLKKNAKIKINQARLDAVSSRQ